TEVQISGVNVFQKNFGNYARYFDEIHANAGAGEDKAVLTDATVEDNHLPPVGVDISQALWMNSFEKIELRTSGGGSEEIETLDEVFAYWNEP
ncbi:MAG: hypothetical protein GXY83_12880, partial [Rhodopirellula sp.]|nr:hypothetical protein [Rhodopirellula sp.]